MRYLFFKVIFLIYVGLGLMLSSCVSLVDKGGRQLSSPTPQVAVQKQVMAKKSPAILKLDTLGHTGVIRDIIVTKDKDIISASKDKTIRVWDSLTGKEKRKILGQIGKGNEGGIFAIALSKDNRYLAVGGYLLNVGAKGSVIRIYDYPSGKLVQVLKSHTDVIPDLAFSTDDRYLISAGDSSVKFWETHNWTLKETINVHDTYVYAVLMLNNSKGGYDIYSAAHDNTLALHYFNDKARLVKQFSAPFKLTSLASNGKHIAVSGSSGKQIFIFNRALTQQRIINNETNSGGLAYSPDGKTLVAGAASNPNNINSYNLPDYRKTTSFKQHTNVVGAIAFLDHQTVVSGGGGNNEIFIWDKNSTEVKTKIVGVGQRIVSVGIKDNSLAWGNVWDCNGKNCNNLQTALNLTTFQRQSHLQNFNRLSREDGLYTLTHKTGGDYGDDNAILDIQYKGQHLAKITRDATTGYRHSSYGWMGSFIVSGGG